MIDRIEQLAFLSVARGCGFAALGIVVFFVALSNELTVALRSAGYLSLLVTVVLLLKAGLAWRQPYRQTEVWIMLKPAERPEATVAQQVISSVLREMYLRFAGQAALFAALFLATGLVWPVLRG
jgi:hypothetical protein